MSRIAFLTHEPFYPPSGGGSAEALYLVEEMVSRGHEVHLFCPKVEDAESVRQGFNVSLYEFDAWKMGRYAAHRNLKYLAYPFLLQRIVERAARQNKFDLVFSQHAIAAVTAGRLKRSLGAPVVMNFLDYLTAFMETWPRYAAPRPAVNALKRFEVNLPKKYSADGVLTVSDTLADYFRQTGYPAEKIKPIYFGFDSELFPFRETPPPKDPVVVMHGSLDQHHLQKIAVEAVAMVSREMPEVTFRFVGHRTGTLETFLARVKAVAPNAKIETTGFVPYSEVAKHLQTATVGIVPYEESTGTHCAFVAKIVEYLAVGLPAVSTPLNSAVQYFGKREPMVRFADFRGDVFGVVLLKALMRPYDMAAARQASERVRRELDWRTISRNAVDFAERVISK
ncbi:MAG TPA: glycosyltransferase family 4 protein [Verrucomicrobiae bacterium]|nr:glycosyltransferase family 4 protein [Verrucomicrobiae bacterium]